MRKIPMRQCLGCREMKPKRELIRVVKNQSGEISIDPVGKKPGRGAYICPTDECLGKAVKTRALERAFSSKIDDGIFQQLRTELSEKNG